MKELSIEQKAKAYDKALKVIKDNLNALNEVTETGAETVNIQSIKNCFYRAFPELRESEDEKIRKELIEFVKSRGGFKQEYIAWLEKQGTSYTKRDVDDAFVEGMAFAKDELEKQSEQKHDWSAEDMSKVQRICKYLDEAKKYYADINEVRECMEWLKSLKDRVQPQPDMVEALRAEYEKGKADAIAETQKEWSEDDEKRLQSCINILKAKSLMGKVDTANTMWLKSLKQRIGG